jgi:hypothetical protein
MAKNVIDCKGKNIQGMLDKLVNDSGCGCRMARMLQGDGDLQYLVVPPDVQSFPSFLASHPRWTGPDAYVAPRDCGIYKTKNGSWPQLVQLSGNCYMTATALYLHFETSWAGQAVPGVANMAKWARQHYTSKMLEHRIYENGGGDSRNMVSSLLADGTLDDVAVDNYPEISRLLRKRGPLLVSSFRVHGDFRNESVHSHSGRYHGRYEGGHAMVLIGICREKGGNVWYLLQNSWKAKQFVEVDQSYFLSVGGMLSYAAVPQGKLINGTAEHNAIYAEMMGGGGVEMLESDV